MLRYGLLLLLISCATVRKSDWPRSTDLTGSAYYHLSAPFGWKQRDSLTEAAILRGNMPDFLRQFVPIHIRYLDSLTGKKTHLTFWAAPDYLSVGTNHDWARVHVTARLAQRLADTLQCFLPTPKMVDLIYQSAPIKLEPVPMYAYRDSTPTFWQHHLIVEGQRKGRKGLIAGIQKDIVQTDRHKQYPQNDRVAIYGWHRLDGKPIQPLYLGHVWWYVDYSQGLRLIHSQLRVNGKWMHYREVFQNPVLRKLIE